MIGNQEVVSVFRVKIIRAYKEALFYLASSRLIIVVKTDCSKENQCIWDRQSGEIIYGACHRCLKMSDSESASSWWEMSPKVRIATQG